jgi:glycosyltransferase involved in cell wall biosynthesis
MRAFFCFAKNTHELTLRNQSRICLFVLIFGFDLWTLSMQPKISLSLVIFCYNEAGNIGRVIDLCQKLLPEISSDFELIVVNDGSSDSTAAEVTAKLAHFPRLRLISHETNKGIGNALRTGYAASIKEYVCAIPGDNQFDLDLLKEVKPFDDSTYYAFYRINTGYSTYRKILSWGNRLFNQHVLGIFLRDVNWVKVYRLSQLRSIQPRLTSSLVESEICAKLYRKGVRPIEMPTNYLQREFGTPKGGGWKTLSLAIRDMSKLVWEVYRFRPK